MTLASSSFLPSRQSIRQDTLAKKDVDEVVEFIKRNENSASDSEDEVLLAGSSRIRTNFQRLLSSSNEEEAEAIRHKQKKKRKRIRSQQVTDSDEEDYLNTSLQKPSCSLKLLQKR